MLIDPLAMATITAAVSVLANEYLKGVVGEAGKETWKAVKSLFGWTSDPHPSEIPEKVAIALEASPDVAEKVLDLLKSSESGTAGTIVGKIQVSDGKIVVAQVIRADTFNM